MFYLYIIKLLTSNIWFLSGHNGFYYLRPLLQYISLTENLNKLNLRNDINRLINYGLQLNNQLHNIIKYKLKWVLRYI